LPPGATKVRGVAVVQAGNGGSAESVSIGVPLVPTGCVPASSALGASTGAEHAAEKRNRLGKTAFIHLRLAL
jgi:hypothetical protein